MPCSLAVHWQYGPCRRGGSAPQRHPGWLPWVRRRVTLPEAMKPMSARERARSGICSGGAARRAQRREHRLGRPWHLPCFVGIHHPRSDIGRYIHGPIPGGPVNLVERSFGGDSQGAQTGEEVKTLAGFRQGLYACMTRWADALFELSDTLVAGEGVTTFPPTHLSLEAGSRRGWGSAYGALRRGVLDEEALRDLLAASRPRGWPLLFAADTSSWVRDDAECSPERAYHHPSRRSSGKPIVAGWGYSWIAQLNFERNSWTAPTDVRRTRPDRTGHRRASQAARAAPRSNRRGPDVRLRLRPDRAVGRPRRGARPDPHAHPVRPRVLRRPAAIRRWPARPATTPRTSLPLGRPENLAGTRRDLRHRGLAVRPRRGTGLERAAPPRTPAFPRSGAAGQTSRRHGSSPGSSSR